MQSRQMVRGLFLAAGIAILTLLIAPAVHVPCIVVHGPASALRAQRAAWLLQILIQASAFLIAGFAARPARREVHSQTELEFRIAPVLLRCNCPMRC
ncbi:MAG TPA: hypothetical protein VG498_02555 [Terriglobales bacterium]|nr:hypothetical protein [Terriglobales bacterium]